MALESRLVIITGGIGGLGCAVGKVLLSQGAHLALLYAPFEASRVEQVLQDTYNIQNGNSPKIHTFECDITSSDSVIAAFSKIQSDKPASVAFPSILINAAGYVNLTPLAETPPEDIVKHLNVNLLGPFLAAQSFHKLYMHAKNEQGSSAPGGRIVNLASQAAHVALDQTGAYCASKSGLIALTRCMASEWGSMGIVANSVSPGPVWTELGKKAWSNTRARDSYQAQIPTGNFAEPEEIAATIAFLCQDLALNINGTDIRVDGGYTAR